MKKNIFSGSPVRLDTWLNARDPSLSRARWQELIKSGHVLVNGRIRKPHYLLREQDVVESEIPPAVPVGIRPEAIPLHVLFEDSDILVLNKPAGLVVHPAPGHDAQDGLAAGNFKFVLHGEKLQGGWALVRLIAA